MPEGWPRDAVAAGDAAVGDALHPLLVAGARRSGDDRGDGDGVKQLHSWVVVGGGGGGGVRSFSRSGGGLKALENKKTAQAVCFWVLREVFGFLWLVVRKRVPECGGGGGSCSECGLSRDLNSFRLGCFVFGGVLRRQKRVFDEKEAEVQGQRTSDG